MVLQGIDVLQEDGSYDKLFHRRRIGLITTPTGLDRNFHSTIECLHKRYRLQALFAPEHGVRGDIPPGSCVDGYRDDSTGLMVYSLYRKDSKHLTEQMLDMIDVVVYDIQDVGSRYYTFIYTMLYAMQDCARAGKPFVILDRVNPLGGSIVEGNRVQADCYSFVGAYPLCMRYGLTIGEFARMANDMLHLDCDLTVIPIKNWNRNMLFIDTDLTWVPPSMNIPRFETALLYSGACLFEGTNLSEGRGTACPFEVIGAPYIKKPQALADRMNAKKLAGVMFRPVYFIPSLSKHQGQLCAGVQIHLTDMRMCSPVQAALFLLYEIQEMFPDFSLLDPIKPGSRPFIRLIAGSDALERRLPPEKILRMYREDSAAFTSEKQFYHIYP